MLHGYRPNLGNAIFKVIAVAMTASAFCLCSDPEFILSRKKLLWAYTGDTYNHDPEEVRKLFAEYGVSDVRIDSTETYIVAEIYL